MEGGAHGGTRPHEQTEECFPKQTDYEEEFLLSAFSVRLCSSFHLPLFLISSSSLHLTVGKMKGDTGTGCEPHHHEDSIYCMCVCVCVLGSGGDSLLIFTHTAQITFCWCHSGISRTVFAVCSFCQVHYQTFTDMCCYIFIFFLRIDAEIMFWKGVKHE